MHPGPTAIDSSPGSWWQIFHDPELDQIERLALDANQNLESAVDRVLQSRLRARIVAADFFPHFEARASARRSASSDDNGIVRNSPPNDLNVATSRISRALTQNAFEDLLSLSWEVDVFGRIRAAYASSQAQAQATMADARGVRLSLTTEVADGYFALRTADEQVAILERTRALRQESLSLNDARVRSGIGLPDDVARAQLEFNNVEADLAEARRQRNGLEKNLALLCGQPSPDFHVPARPLGTTNPPARPHDVSAGLLSRRPDVAASERRLAATLQDIRQARAELLPRITIGGYIGQESEDFARLTNHSSHEASIMPVISIPVFEGGRNVANLQLVRARRDETAAAYRETVLTAFREADTALDDLEQRATQFAAQERAVGNAQTVLGFSTDRFSRGTISYFQVVTDQANLLGTQLGAARTRNARFAAVVDLVRALGGSWPDPDGTPRK